MQLSAATKPKPQPDDDVRLIGGNVNGRYTLSGSSSVRCFACRAQSISPRQVVLSAPVSGDVGDPVNIHFSDFGILQANISRVIDFGFVADLLASDDDRALIAAKIRWLRKHVTSSVVDHRQHKRSLPRNPRSSLILNDGSKRDCFIIDMSPSGAAVSAEYAPQFDEALAVGRAVGRVVRHLELGFAVRFNTVIGDADLDRILRHIDEPIAIVEP